MIFISVPGWRPRSATVMLASHEWHSVFAVLLLRALMVLRLDGWRLPETLPREAQVAAPCATCSAISARR